MPRSNAWMAPLTGVAFVIVLIVSFTIAGEPEGADEPVQEIVGHYVDNKDEIQIGSALVIPAGLLLIAFGAYLRRFLAAATGETSILPLIAFVGFVAVAIGAAIDATISFALAEAAEDIDPTAVQALQALWDNDFLPMALGVSCFLWGTGLAVLQTGVLPKWLGGLMILLGVISFTPIGFASALASALIVLGLSIYFAMSERKSGGGAAPAAPSAPAAP